MLVGAPLRNKCREITNAYYQEKNMLEQHYYDRHGDHSFILIEHKTY